MTKKLTIPQRIELKRNPDFGDKGLPDVHCAVCGKAIKNPKQFLHLFWGDTVVTEEEAARIIATEGSGGDLLFFPVGNDCLKKHPELKPFLKALTSEELSDYYPSIGSQPIPPAAMETIEVGDYVRIKPEVRLSEKYHPEQHAFQRERGIGIVELCNKDMEWFKIGWHHDRVEYSYFFAGYQLEHVDIAALSAALAQVDEIHASLKQERDDGLQAEADYAKFYDTNDAEREEREYQEVLAYRALDAQPGLLAQIAALQAENLTLRNYGVSSAETIEALRARVKTLERDCTNMKTDLYDLVMPEGTTDAGEKAQRQEILGKYD